MWHNSVGVEQLNDIVCTTEDMLSQDENIVDGHTSGGQYVTWSLACVDCAWSDAIGQQAANQESPVLPRCKVQTIKG